MAKYETPKYEKLEAAGKNNFFVRLCYGYVEHTLGMNTEEMTIREVIQEFLDSKGLKSPREFFDKAFKKNNTKKDEKWEQELSKYIAEKDKHFKRYDVGKATIYKVGTNYAVFDFTRKPRTGKVYDTLIASAKTLGEAKSEALKLK